LDYQKQKGISMKLIIFGASGATGKILVEQALAQGHQVVAFVRTPSKVTITHANLQVAQGDIFDVESIKKAMKGCDAALSALGTDTLSNVTLYSGSAKAILAAMKASGVRRLVYITSANVPEGIQRSEFEEGLRNGYLREAYADMRSAEAEIMQSDVDWTIVRPGGYTDEVYKKPIRVDMNSLPGDASFISRADVASFMLRCLQSGQYVHTAPFLGAFQATPPQWTPPAESTSTGADPGDLWKKD